MSSKAAIDVLQRAVGRTIGKVTLGASPFDLTITFTDGSVVVLNGDIEGEVIADWSHMTAPQDQRSSMSET